MPDRDPLVFPAVGDVLTNGADRLEVDAVNAGWVAFRVVLEDGALFARKVKLGQWRRLCVQEGARVLEAAP